MGKYGPNLIRPVPKVVPCRLCGAECVEAFTFATENATEAVGDAWGNGLSKAIAYLDKLEAAILCSDCERLRAKDRHPS